MSEEILKLTEGTKIERGANGVKLTVVVGKVSRWGISGVCANAPIFMVSGVEVCREDFDAICRMLSLGGKDL